ncbi:MAG: CYTH domain-containing protein [Clostridiales bacterium]|jgi:CYTH domain-containing protein|nr:CYTH domain-containing protein [Clostridiales bacterium]
MAERDGLEIERKFILDDPPFNLNGFKHYEITQAYISTDPQIRLRGTGSAYYLTVKMPSGDVRREFETELTKQQFDALWKKTEPRAIIKTRYIIPMQDGLNAEYDVYSGFLEGLRTVEVEFESIEDRDAFMPPEWFGRDVTSDYRYSNAELARTGVIPK